MFVSNLLEDKTRRCLIAVYINDLAYVIKSSILVLSVEAETMLSILLYTDDVVLSQVAIDNYF